jgi:hypothetical protein
MKHAIQLTTCTIEINENTSLSDMERNCPLFFKTKHGKRETYTIHRGQLIVRNTVQFTGGRPERKTAVYMYTPDLEGSPDLFCVSSGSNLKSIDGAKGLIDRIIEGKKYEYGM